MTRLVARWIYSRPLSRARGPHEDAAGTQRDPARIALRTDVHDARSRLEPRGAQLRSAEIEEHAARTAELVPRRRDVRAHRFPLGGSVVRTVDAREVHARGEELAHERRIVRRLAGERHEESGRTRAARRTEELRRVHGEQRDFVKQTKRSLTSPDLFMSPRLQRRDWLHLQRFSPCEVSTTCQRSSPLLSVANRCICSHSRRFARGLMNRSG